MSTAATRHSTPRGGIGQAPSPDSAVQTESREANASAARESSGGWPLERILFLMAGTMTGLSAVLSAVVSPWFLLLTGFVAINQLAFVALGNCPSSWALQRFFGVERATCR